MTSGAKTTHRGRASQVVKRLLAAGLAVALAGCVESAGDLDASAPAQTPQAQAEPPSQAVAPAGASPRAASAAFTRIDGAPGPVLAAFIQKLAAETKGHDIHSVQPDAAKYIVHGYLSATKTSGGAVFGYVWDVFDSHQRRIQRVEDQITAPGAAADPWSLANDRVLGSLAAKSAADLAALLSRTPEALREGTVAASQTGSGQTRASVAEASALR